MTQTTSHGKVYNKENAQEFAWIQSRYRIEEVHLTIITQHLTAGMPLELPDPVQMLSSKTLEPSQSSRGKRHP